MHFVAGSHLNVVVSLSHRNPFHLCFSHTFLYFDSWNNYMGLILLAGNWQITKFTPLKRTPFKISFHWSDCKYSCTFLWLIRNSKKHRTLTCFLSCTRTHTHAHASEVFFYVSRWVCVCVIVHVMHRLMLMLFCIAVESVPDHWKICLISTIDMITWLLLLLLLLFMLMI